MKNVFKIINITKLFGEVYGHKNLMYIIAFHKSNSQPENIQILVASLQRGGFQNVKNGGH